MATELITGIQLGTNNYFNRNTSPNVGYPFPTGSPFTLVVEFTSSLSTTQGFGVFSSNSPTVGSNIFIGGTSAGVIDMYVGATNIRLRPTESELVRGDLLRIVIVATGGAAGTVGTFRLFYKLPDKQTEYTELTNGPTNYNVNQCTFSTFTIGHVYNYAYGKDAQLRSYAMSRQYLSGTELEYFLRTENVSALSELKYYYRAQDIQEGTSDYPNNYVWPNVAASAVSVDTRLISNQPFSTNPITFITKTFDQTIEIPWRDGSGDSIKFLYNSTQGDEEIKVISDPNYTINDRSKTVKISEAGNTSNIGVTITIDQPTNRLGIGSMVIGTSFVVY